MWMRLNPKLQIILHYSMQKFHPFPFHFWNCLVHKRNILFGILKKKSKGNEKLLESISRHQNYSLHFSTFSSHPRHLNASFALHWLLNHPIVSIFIHLLWFTNRDSAVAYLFITFHTSHSFYRGVFLGSVPAMSQCLVFPCSALLLFLRCHIPFLIKIWHLCPNLARSLSSAELENLFVCCAQRIFKLCRKDWTHSTKRKIYGFEQGWKF